jgi:hypothetical protein
VEYNAARMKVWPVWLWLVVRLEDLAREFSLKNDHAPTPSDGVNQ